MRLVINALCKKVLLPVMLAASAISCVSAKPLSEASTVSAIVKNQNVQLEFDTIYGFDEICNRRKSVVTWSIIEKDLTKYGIGTDKVNWLFSSDTCTKVVDPKLNYLTIRELRDKNSSLYVYYILRPEGVLMVKINLILVLETISESWLTTTSKPAATAKYTSQLKIIIAQCLTLQ